jgi:hypothetical protein
MKKYKVITHTLGNDESGKRAWIKPKDAGFRNLDQVSADEFNSQFENTGVKYEAVEESEVEKTEVTTSRKRK